MSDPESNEPAAKRIKTVNQNNGDGDTTDNLLIEVPDDSASNHDEEDEQIGEEDEDFVWDDYDWKDIGDTGCEQNEAACMSMNGGQLLELMNAKIAEIKSKVPEETQITRALLMKYEWDNVKLSNDYFSLGKKECYKMIGMELEVPANDKESSNVECCICYEKTIISKLACSHEVCKDCLSIHVGTEVDKRSCCIQCPACPVPLNEFQIIEILGENAGKFQRNLIEGFVLTNPHIKWCPSPDTQCQLAICVKAPAESQCVTCNYCANTFCFICQSYVHEPLSCDLLAQWLEKRSREVNTLWITQNSKPCPRCRAAIQKNGGCNHMTCRCKHEFCWLCLENWRGHRADECNRYRGAPQQEENAAATDALTNEERLAVDTRRYAFYLGRFTTHEESLNFEKENRVKMVNSIQCFKKTLNLNFSEEDGQLLIEALGVLNLCRKTLMCTFAYAYYIKTNLQLTIFEDNQANLQNFTENLSELIEFDATFKSLKENKWAEYRKKMFDAMDNCKKRREVLVTHAKEGTLQFEVKPVQPTAETP